MSFFDFACVGQSFETNLDDDVFNQPAAKPEWKTNPHPKRARVANAHPQRLPEPTAEPVTAPEPPKRKTLTLAVSRDVVRSTTVVKDEIAVYIRKTVFDIAMDKQAEERAAAEEAARLEEAKVKAAQKPKVSRKRHKDAKAARHAKRAETTKGPDKGPQGSMLTRRGVCHHVPYDKLARLPG